MSTDSRERPLKSKLWRGDAGWLAFSFLPIVGFGLWLRSLGQERVPYRFLNASEVLPNDDIGGTFRNFAGHPWTIATYTLQDTPDNVIESAWPELASQGWTTDWCGRYYGGYRRNGEIISIKYNFRKRRVIVETLSRADGGLFEAFRAWLPRFGVKP